MYYSIGRLSCCLSTVNVFVVPGYRVFVNS